MDLCTRQGAEILRRRIIAARERAGMPVGDLIVANTGAKFNGRVIWGVRDRPPLEPIEIPKVKLEPRVDPAWFAEADEICRRVLADHVRVSLEQVRGGGGQRDLRLSAARRACIRAVDAAGVADCRAGIAEFFRIDPSTVSLAITHGRRKDREPQQVAA